MEKDHNGILGPENSVESPILVNKICYITLLYQMYEFGIAFKIMTSMVI